MFVPKIYPYRHVYVYVYTHIHIYIYTHKHSGACCVYMYTHTCICTIPPDIGMATSKTKHFHSGFSMGPRPSVLRESAGVPLSPNLQAQILNPNPSALNPKP